MKRHAGLGLRHVVVFFSGLAFVLGASLGGAQVRAPGNDKQLPPPAQKAPPFQQGDSGGGGSGGGGGGDGGPRIVHGWFTNPGEYGGYSVSVSRAGEGGTTLGNVHVTPGSKTVTAAAGTSFASVNAGQYIMIPGTLDPDPGLFPFYWVTAKTSDSSIEITPVNPGGILMPFNDTRGYSGPAAPPEGLPAKVLMNIVPIYTVTFAQPFQNAPTIVVSSRGHHAGPDAGATQAINVAQVLQSGPDPMPNDRFQVFVYQYPFSPYNQPTATIDFIAIGN